jgi:hypothetical protein
LLVNGSNSHGPRGGRIDPWNGFSFYLDASAIGLMSSCDDFNERRFSRAILAEQRVHLAPVKIKGDAP